MSRTQLNVKLSEEQNLICAAAVLHLTEGLKIDEAIKTLMEKKKKAEEVISSSEYRDKILWAVSNNICDYTFKTPGLGLETRTRMIVEYLKD